MTITMLNDRVQTGEPGAAKRMVLSLQPELLRLASTILRDHEEAEEAVQDALLAALKNLETYRGEASYKTWLFSITINVCRRRRQKQIARRQLSQALQAIFRLGAGPAHPEETIIRGETCTAVRRAMNQLDEKHRMPIVLFYDHDLSIAEIAETLGLPQGTVLSRLHTAREKLRHVLQNQIHPSGEVR